MNYLVYSLQAVAVVFLFLAFKEFLKYIKNKKLTELWHKLYQAYIKDDFATVNKTVKKIKKIEDDPLLKLIEVEKFLYGKTVFQDKKKVLDLLLEIDKIPLPKKTTLESSEYTQKLAEKSKKTQNKLKKERYIKKIKAKAREIWNENEFWKLKYEIDLKTGVIQK